MSFIVVVSDDAGKHKVHVIAFRFEKYRFRDYSVWNGLLYARLQIKIYFVWQ